jgi:hypothetical protein
VALSLNASAIEICNLIKKKKKKKKKKNYKKIKLLLYVYKIIVLLKFCYWRSKYKIILTRVYLLKYILALRRLYRKIEIYRNRKSKILSKSYNVQFNKIY